jgi:hypothetical protein
MSADRANYELRQAGLLDALQGRDSNPDGFVADDLAAASESLLRKRARPVAENWPALTHALGSGFLPEFERFARATPLPRGDVGMVDGFMFANSLDLSVLTDDARLEFLLARGAFELRPAGLQPRRGLFLGTALLAAPRRLVVVIHIPRRGRQHVTVPIGMRRSA